MATYIVDMQGFRGAGGFVFCEACVLRMHGPVSSILKTIDFMPPDTTPSPAEARQNAWLTEYHHGVPWIDRYNRRAQYENGLRSLTALLCDASRVYVKGREKEAWLSPFVPNGCSIIDTAELGMQALTKCREKFKNRCCGFHNQFASARWNVAAMFDFLTSRDMDSVIKQIKESCEADKTAANLQESHFLRAVTEAAGCQRSPSTSS
jgi:hypothetical protein